MTANVADVEVYADLHCEIDSSSLLIRSAGRTIVVEVPDMATGLKILQLSSPWGCSSRRELVLESLDQFGLTVELRTNSVVLLAAGHESSNWLLCRFGVRHLRPSLRTLPRIGTLLVRRSFRLSH